MKLYQPLMNNVCFFRTVPDLAFTKLLLQINNYCNMNCKHCFISSNSNGEDIDFILIKDNLVRFIIENQVKSVTLTGGEPLMHEHIEDFVTLITDLNVKVTICTNALLLKKKFIDKLAGHKLLKFNVSLDGFSDESYSSFRGVSLKSFNVVINNINSLAELNLLKGLLVTPNKFSSINEYVKLVEYANTINAEYVLFNPLSEYGRGALNRIGFTDKQMITLRETIISLELEVESLFTRFPCDSKQNTSCEYERIIYIFTSGEITFCPYIAFINDNIKEKAIIGNLYKQIFIVKNGLEQFNLKLKVPKKLTNCLSDLIRKET